MCYCRGAVNTMLSAHNAQLAYGFGFTDGGMDLTPPMILLEKLDKKKRSKLPTLIATHCPFCGENYKTGEPT